MVASNILAVSFSDFSTLVEAAGYKPVQYSKTGYFVKTLSGIRCEFQCTRGGVFSAGYGSNASIVSSLKDYLIKDGKSAVEGLEIEKVLTGSVNFLGLTVESFLKFVTFVEAFALPVSKATVKKAATEVTGPKKEKVIKAIVKADKAEKEPTAKTIAHVKKGMTVDEAVKIATAKSVETGATTADDLKKIEDIKATNLARLKAVGAKFASNNAVLPAAEVPTLTVDNEATEADLADMPAFLRNDAVMSSVREAE